MTILTETEILKASLDQLAKDYAVAITALQEAERYLAPLPGSHENLTLAYMTIRAALVTLGED